MKQKGFVLITVLLVLILIGIVVDIVITHRAISTMPARSSLPCQAIPLRYISEYPDCADKLLQALNITNVHIASPETYDSQRT